MESTTEPRDLSSEHNPGNDVILFIMVGLLAGQILKHFANKTKIPYTPLLAITGIVIGLIAEHLGKWGDGAEFISNIDPHMFFLLFLPPLIFESAFSIDWHIIKVEIIQILILAGPCLLINSFITAVVMRWVLWYQEEFTFSAAVMFGAIISATDPVAVVSLLKELGASRTLSTMIEGESLINDGTAYVMFSVCLEIVKGEPFNAGTVAHLFFRLSFGGPLLGLVIGIILSFWLKRITNNSILETNLTIVAAYMVFYAAEVWDLEVSGILALVALGLYMTKTGKTTISHQSEETLHHIWSYLGFVSETMVFVIAGLLIAMKVFKEDSIIGWEDYLKLLALYVFLHVIRFGMIAILKWPLSKMGYGLNWPQAVVLGYSGLRGAVSLILALIVYLDHEINDHIRDIVLFHTAGIALLTLVINGPTMGFVVRKLGLMRMSSVQKKTLKNLIKAYRKEVHEVLEELKVKKNFSRVDWEVLKKVACADKIRKDIFKQRGIQKEAEDFLPSTRYGGEDLVIDNKEYSEDELFIEAKHRYLTTLKGIYWGFFENSQCTAETVLLLIESADRAIDHETDEIKDFTFIESYFKGSWFLKILMKLKKNFIFRKLAKRYLYTNISFIYDVTVNYVEAHHECKHLIPEIIHNEKILQRLGIEVDNEVRKAENKLDRELEENFPEVLKAVQHKRGGYYLINKMRAFVTEMIEHGQIDFKEANFFLRYLLKEERNLQLGKLKIDFEDADVDFRSNCQLAKVFSNDQLDELMKTFKEHNYSPNEVIIKQGENLKNLYYISKGVVHEKNGHINDVDAPKIRNRAGDILGLQFITKDEGKSFTNCYAKTVCTCRSFPVSALRGMIASKEQEKKLWNYIGPSLIQLNPDRFQRLVELDALQLKTLMKNSTYEWYNPGQTLKLENGCILFEGDLEEIEDGNNREEDLNVDKLDNDEKESNSRSLKIKSYSFIYPTQTTYRAISEVRLYAFPEVLRDSWLCFNPQVFNEAFSILPGPGTARHQNTIRDKQNTINRRERTVLLGIPRNLAHEDPLNTFRVGSMGVPNYNQYNLPSHLQGLMGAGTILPKGYTRPLPMLQNANTIAPPADGIEHKVSSLHSLNKNGVKGRLDNTDEESKNNAVDPSEIKLRAKKGSSIEAKSNTEGVSSSEQDSSEKGSSGDDEEASDEEERSSDTH